VGKRVFVCIGIPLVSDSICESFSVLTEWWATKTRCPPYMANRRQNALPTIDFVSDSICELFSVLTKWWATKTRCPPYMANRRQNALPTIDFVSDSICELFSVLTKWWAIKTRCPPYLAHQKRCVGRTLLIKCFHCIIKGFMFRFQSHFLQFRFKFNTVNLCI